MDDEVPMRSPGDDSPADPSALPAELEEALEQAIAAGRVTLPALPAVANELLTATFSDECDLARCEEILGRDPHLAAQVLRAANSAMFAPTTPIRSLGRALAHLGLLKLRGVAMSVACESSVYVLDTFQAEATALLEHARWVAKLAQVAARPLLVDGDEASLTGLLHDVGRVALLQTIEQLRVVLRVKRKRTFSVAGPVALAATDRHHAAVGAAVLRKWELPEALVSVVEHHHQPDRLEGPLRRMAQAVALADLVAKGDLDAAVATAARLELDAGVVTEMAHASADPPDDAPPVEPA